MKKNILYVLLSGVVFGTHPNDQFRKYAYNSTFIETGTWYGSGIEAALNSGFKKIYSIELSNDLYEYNKNKFKNFSNITIIKGDSKEKIKDILNILNERATFWLDAHGCGGKSSYSDTYTALIGELDAISKHHIKNHTILIDDVRLFATGEMDFISKESVIEMLKTINPNYKIYFIDCGFKNDILVAEI